MINKKDLKNKFVNMLAVGITGEGRRDSRHRMQLLLNA
jgi:hypothetical protein